VNGFAWTELKLSTTTYILNGRKKFVLQYKFEERQLFKFEVYDADDNSSNLNNHDFIGSIECSLGEIVAASGKGFTKHLIGELHFCVY